MTSGKMQPEESFWKKIQKQKIMLEEIGRNRIITTVSSGFAFALIVQTLLRKDREQLKPMLDGAFGQKENSMDNKVEETEIMALLKFGEEDHAKAFMDKGLIFFNTINYFNSVEDDFRGDKFEGASQIMQGDRIKLSITNSIGETIKFEDPWKINHMIIKDRWQNQPSHMYCLYMLKNEITKDQLAIDEKVLQFGKYAALIHKPESFIQRISEALNEKKYKWKSDIVRYVDIKTIHGTYDYFKKPNTYNYQNEYRFVISTNTTLPEIIEIGSLSDIVEIIDEKGIRSIKIADK